MKVEVIATRGEESTEYFQDRLAFNSAKLQTDMPGRGKQRVLIAADPRGRRDASASKYHKKRKGGTVLAAQRKGKGDEEIMVEGLESHKEALGMGNLLEGKGDCGGYSGKQGRNSRNFTC